ncbi:hypothetical protein [Floridanema evergladense]|uniref:Uncharacterized protein n=1 Tax=Floridaenema evergladense BLCC-F167 TaxID=3153639 RepID=A0ABV4WIH0_9CYAN
MISLFGGIIIAIGNLSEERQQEVLDFTCGLEQKRSCSQCDRLL